MCREQSLVALAALRLLPEPLLRYPVHRTTIRAHYVQRVAHLNAILNAPYGVPQQQYIAADLIGAVERNLSFSGRCYTAVTG
jgi:hypothetical protein